MLETIRIPWLHDRHNHTSFYASLTGCLNLDGMAMAEAVAGVGALPKDRLSMVYGWHSAKLPFAPEDLSRMPPAIIVNFSMHGFALSGEAPAMLAATEPELVAKRNDKDWCERNLASLLEVFSHTAHLTQEKLASFMDRMETLGLAVADDMLLPGEEAFQVILGSRWGRHIKCWATPRTFKTLGRSGQEACAGLKFFMDGALGSGTAGIDGEFLDGRKGLLLHEDEALRRTFGEAHAFGKPLAIHAIGDLAIEQAIRVLEQLHRDGLSFPLVRLEHVQFVRLSQARRAKDLGLTLSMQPNFNSDSVDYADRLAPAWLEINNPFRMLIDEAGFVPGQDLILGSDGMPHGVENALQWSLFPAYAGQRLTVEELVAGYGGHPEGAGQSVLAIDRAARRVKLLESKAGN
jgi:predicted amidohydrolase YtcJ